MKDLPVHSAMLSIQLFFGLPLLRLPSTVPCNITSVRPSDLVTCPYHFGFRRFRVARRSSYGPICFMMVVRTCGTGLPGRAKRVQRFERSDGLDTALYKISSPLPLQQQDVVCQKHQKYKTRCDRQFNYMVFKYMTMSLASHCFIVTQVIVPSRRVAWGKRPPLREVSRYFCIIVYLNRFVSENIVLCNLHM